jgi:hypothetical protein
MILGFRRDVYETCALLGYYAASCGICFVSGPIRYPETSVNNYHTTPLNIPEERRYQNLTSLIQESVRVKRVCISDYDIFSKSITYITTKYKILSFGY